MKIAIYDDEEMIFADCISILLIDIPINYCKKNKSMI